ncbi:sensor histidine kinase [Coraliomargarita sp. W4R53]
MIISDLQSETLRKRSLLEVDRLQYAFNELNHDIVFIANLPIVNELANIRPSAAWTEERARNDLATIFEVMLRAKPNYSQIRFIHAANQGLEYVRVDQRNGHVSRADDDQLQEKANRDYFREASQKQAGEIYYSEINLNQEGGVVEFPNRPVLRVAMPIYDNSDTFAGIVIINLNFRSFIDSVLRKGLDRSRYDYYLLNEDGYFLFHPEPSYTFGFDLGIDLTAGHVFPELKEYSHSAEETITFRTDALFDASSHLVHFTKFKVFDPPRELAFGIVGSYDDIGRASLYTTTAIIIAMGLLTLLSLFLAIWFSSQITKPLERITLATRSLSINGASDILLPTERSDEIGDLAKTFLEMKDSIERHQGHLLHANQRLSEMNRDLEHFARVASHDLREPIQRIAGLASLYQEECASSGGDSSSDILNQLHIECGIALSQLADFREFTDITQDVSLIREECLVEEIIVSVLNEFAEPLKQRRVEVEMALQPQLSIYKNLVRVLYRNLVDNALKHAKHDGFKLHFTVEEDLAGDVILGVLNSDSSIRDDSFVSAFDVFTKLEDCPTGHGMGLAICKRIVNFHSGRIWLESDSNHVHVKYKLKEE